jgi:hypothetical protein
VTAGLSRRHAVNGDRAWLRLVFFWLRVWRWWWGWAGLGWGVARGTLELAAAANGVGECGRVERGSVPEMAAAPARGFPAGVGSEPTCH